MKSALTRKRVANALTIRIVNAKEPDELMYLIIYGLGDSLL